MDELLKSWLITMNLLWYWILKEEFLALFKRNFFPTIAKKEVETTSNSPSHIWRKMSLVNFNQISKRQGHCDTEYKANADYHKQALHIHKTRDYSSCAFRAATSKRSQNYIKTHDIKSKLTGYHQIDLKEKVIASSSYEEHHVSDRFSDDERTVQGNTKGNQ